MTGLSDAEREAFLSITRIGIVTTYRQSGLPVSVPVWFEWDGSIARAFTYAGSGKLKRLESNPRASLLAVNAVGEPEAWVSLTGDMTIKQDGAAELAERLARRYWDPMDSEQQAKPALWQQAASALRVLELVPQSIRSSKG